MLDARSLTQVIQGAAIHVEGVCRKIQTTSNGSTFIVGASDIYDEQVWRREIRQGLFAGEDRGDAPWGGKGVGPAASCFGRFCHVDELAAVIRGYSQDARCDCSYVLPRASGFAEPHERVVR